MVVFGDAVGVPGIGKALIEPVASKSAGRGVGSGRGDVGGGGVVVVVDAARALGKAAHPTAPIESDPTSTARPRRFVQVIVREIRSSDGRNRSTAVASAATGSTVPGKRLHHTRAWIGARVRVS
jgi:hypothetical protein